MKEASQNVADGPDGFVTRFNVGDAVTIPAHYVAVKADHRLHGVVHSVTFAADLVLYDVEVPLMPDQRAAVIHNVHSSDVLQRSEVA